MPLRMRQTVHPCVLSILVTLALCGFGMFVSAASAVVIDEFPLDASPTGITAGPDGNLWVTTNAPSILRIAPSGHVTARYPLTGTPGVETLPLEPTFSGGSLWFTITRTDNTTYQSTTALARRAPDGIISELPFPGGSVSLAAGPSGSVWFPTVGGVGRVTPGGVVTTVGGIPGTATSVAPDQMGGVWVIAGGGQDVTQVSTAGVATQTKLPGSVWKVATAPASPVVWFAGRESLCCYGASSFDFSIWLAPGGTGIKAPSGFATFVQDLAVGPDGNAWASDDNGAIARVGTSGRYSVVGRGAPSPAVGLTAGPGATVWFISRATHGQPDPPGLVGRITLDTPKATTQSAVDVGQTGAGLSAVVTPYGVASRVRFEFGKTTDYGAATRWRDVGDGDDPVARAARVEGLEPGTTYHYRAVVTNALGTVAGVDRTLATQPLPPPPPVPPADVDGDGYAAAVDCNDHAPAVFPGAAEIPGDGVDQGCVGGDAPLPRFFPHVTAYFKTKAQRWSRFTALTIEGLPTGTVVHLKCSGPGCRFTSWSRRLPREAPKLKLLSHLEGSKLGPSAVLELRVELPGHLGTVVRWKIGPPPRPVVTCLRPGARKDSRC